MNYGNIMATPLHLLIVTLIESEGTIGYDDIMTRVLAKGHAMSAFEVAMVQVHRHPRIKVGSGLVYSVAVVKAPTVNSHVVWVREHYPWPGEDFIMPFPDIDMSWLVMKPEDAEAYKAALKGVPITRARLKRVHTRRENSARNHQAPVKRGFTGLAK